MWAVPSGGQPHMHMWTELELHVMQIYAICEFAWPTEANVLFTPPPSGKN